MKKTPYSNNQKRYLKTGLKFCTFVFKDNYFYNMIDN